MRKQKGITLIALIISIVVLLILAVVTIGEVRDSKIIRHAQNAASDYTIAQEKEQIGLAVSEWQIEKTISGNNPIFKDAITNALQGQAVVVENADGSLTVTFESENAYTVTKDGEITPVTKGITITPATLTLETGKEELITVTATGVDITNLAFSVEPIGIVEVTKGTDGKATVKAGTTAGTATITATCENYTSTCTVTVTEQLSVWQSRGVKSVVFDKVYYNTTKKCGNNDNIGFMFALCEEKYEEGAVWINYEYDSSKTIDNSIGNGSAPSDIVHSMMNPEEEENPTAYGFYDGVSFKNVEMGQWFTIQYMEGYAKLYKSDTEPKFTETDGKKYLKETSVEFLCELHDTIWEANGLTSSNVRFGATYYDADNWYFMEEGSSKKGFILSLQEDGSIQYQLWTGKDNMQSYNAEEVVSGLKSGYGLCGENYLILPIFEEQIAKFVFNEDNTVTVYEGTSVDDQNFVLQGNALKIQE